MPIMHRLLQLAKHNLGFLILIAIIGGAYLSLRTPASDIASEEQFAALFTAGRPVLVEFFSNT